MLRFASIATLLLVGLPVLPGQAQPVYEWIEVDGLTPHPPEGGVKYAWDLVWDAQQELVLAATQYGQQNTWAWDGSSWTDTGFLTPSPFDSDGLVYHGATETVYRLQGTESFEPSITWAFVPDVGWVQVDSDGPTSRTRFAWAYDAKRERTVLFGGSWGVQGTLSPYVWEWDGFDWAVYETPDPKPERRINPAMVYDEKNEVVVLFGGTSDITIESTYFGDTWTWDGVQWQQVASTGPSPRSKHTMIYDPDRQKVLLFGGYAPGSQRLNDLWEWDGSTWTQIVGANGPSMEGEPGFAYDRVRDEGVLYSGYRIEDDEYTPATEVWRLQVVERWVDFSYTGLETGHFQTPFNTLAEGVQALPPEGKLFIKSGTTSEAITITKQIEVFTPSGPVIVGE